MIAHFVPNRNCITTLAEKCKSLIWRLNGEENTVDALRIFGDDCLIVNRSVGELEKALFVFTYESKHIEVIKRKKEWFSKLTDMPRSLWFIQSGHEPSPERAEQRPEKVFCNYKSGL